MRRYMIGYGIWNAQDMIGWLLEGINYYVPKIVEIRFVFDNCSDESESNYDLMVGQIITNRRETAHVRASKMSGPEPLDEIGIHNELMRYFMDETECDVLIVPQADQRIIGPILPQIEGLLNHYHDRVGLIGGRDGYEGNFNNPVGSLWSESALDTNARLAPGANQERSLLNSGPMIYTRKTVETVGYFDPQFEHWFFWEDYCLRCTEKNLPNIVLGTEIRHMKFGHTPPTTYYTDGSHPRDRGRMRAKWPGRHY